MYVCAVDVCGGLPWNFAEELQKLASGCGDPSTVWYAELGEDCGLEALLEKAKATVASANKNYKSGAMEMKSILKDMCW